VPLAEKLFWTFSALLVYLVASQIPLYGIKATGGNDAYYILRRMLASNERTLMELGIAPIITSGMIMQLLTGAKIIDVNLNAPGDRALYQSASKLLGVLITVGEALAYVLSGMYGPVSQLGTVTSMLLVAQLFVSGIIVLMLDDLLSKGWGLGGGINLFIVTNICEGIVWGALSPMTYNLGGSTQFEGALVETVRLLFTEKSLPKGLYKAFFRPDLPNMLSLLATAVVFLVVIYVQGLKMELPLRFVNVRGQEGKYPIKLFYTSNMPIILLSALVGNVYFFSQVLYRRYPGNVLVKLLGVWADKPGSGRSEPVWGLSYVLSPPRELADLAEAPLRSLFYIIFMLTACAMFAKMWVEISGSGPRDVARQLEDQGVNLKANGLRKKLDKMIPTAAAFGGMCVALLSIFADLLGAIGSGTGILMAVSIIFDLAEKLAKEQQQEQKKQ
jgi:protein transport protein SEC61 subunit alpha